MKALLSGPHDAPRRANTSAAAASLVVKAGTGALLRLLANTTAAGSQYLQLHDAAALPADGAVPIVSIPVAAGGFVDVDFNLVGLPMANGIVVCNSSTAATKTLGAADLLITAVYR